MIIKECAHICFKDLWDMPSEGTCNLFPDCYPNGWLRRFIPCVAISISKCPYKLFAVGKIDKEELNKRIMEIQKERNKQCSEKHIH